MNSRRNFLRTAMSLGTLTATGGFSRLGLLNAITQPAGPYRALVCVFLYGGNDSNNLVVPLDTTSYNSYKSIRAGLALDSATLVPFANKAYGLHPRFTDISSIEKQVALVANVGNLVQPTTMTQYKNNQVALPGNLFSHADQQAEWQTAVAPGNSTTGWAGRLADQMEKHNTGSYPTFISVAGNALFGVGAATHPGSVTPGAPVGLQGFGTDPASVARLDALKSLAKQDTMHTDSGAILLRQAGINMDNALVDADTLNKALTSAKPITTVFPATSIGQQLLEVAKLIQIRSALSMNRQIFFCSLGGFDTHTAQLTDQDRLFSQLSPALAAFYKATEELTVADQVTTFTESDFSRTLQPNSNGGTDHAWGSHHIVMGASVKGNAIYGKFPKIELNGPDDVGEGRWLPSTSVEQYGATLAQWFGLPKTDLAKVFPTVGAYPTSDVGFFG